MKVLMSKVAMKIKFIIYGIIIVAVCVFAFIIDFFN